MANGEPHKCVKDGLTYPVVIAMRRFGFQMIGFLRMGERYVWMLRLESLTRAFIIGSLGFRLLCLAKLLTACARDNR